MLVEALAERTSWLSERLRAKGFSENSQMDVTPGRTYEVHAIVLWSGIPFFQIVSDAEYILWLPAAAFRILDGSIPVDWTVNQFDEDIPLIFAPPFISRDKQSYSDMVEGDRAQVREFKARLEQRRL